MAPMRVVGIMSEQTATSTASPDQRREPQRIGSSSFPDRNDMMPLRQRGTPSAPP
jgi:hypothetical protein